MTVPIMILMVFAWCSMVLQSGEVDSGDAVAPGSGYAASGVQVLAMSAVELRLVSVAVCDTVDVVSVDGGVVDSLGRSSVSFVPLMMFVIFPRPLPLSSSPSPVDVVAGEVCRADTWVSASEVDDVVVTTS